MEEKNYFLAKWLNQEITEEELKKHVSEDEIRSYKKIIAATQQLKTPDFNKEKVLETVLNSKKSKVRKLNFTKHIYKVAALIAVIFATYWFTSNQTDEFSTQYSEKTNFNLPDNSKVELNAGSTASFKTKNWTNNRTIKLNGEAYFKVEKGSKFSVETKHGIISVLGTQFNIIARENFFEVVCFEGLVSVDYNKKSIKLPAGNSLKIMNTIESKNTNITDSKPSWIDNSSTFKSMPYSYVIDEFERQYNVEITYPSDIENSLFTGNFEHNKLELALKAISIPMDLNYSINKGKVVLTLK